MLANETCVLRLDAMPSPGPSSESDPIKLDLFLFSRFLPQVQKSSAILKFSLEEKTSVACSVAAEGLTIKRLHITYSTM